MRCVRVILLLIFCILPQYLVSFSSQDAERFYSKGEYSKAKDLYQEVLTKNPKNKLIYLELAFLYKELGDYKNTIHYLKEYLRFNNSNEIRLLLIETLYLYGEPEAALKTIKGLKTGYYNWRLYLYLGLIYEELGKDSQAIDYYQKSLRHQKNTISLYRLGKIFYHQKKYFQAVKFFKELIAFEPSIRLASYYLGSSYLKDKNLVSAYKHLDKAGNFYPHNKRINRDLVLAKKGLGKDYFIEKTKQLLERREKIKLASYKPLEDIFKVRVGIIREAEQVSFKCSGHFKIKTDTAELVLKRDKFYTIALDGNRLYLLDYDSSKKIRQLDSPTLLVSENFPFYIFGVKHGRDQFWQSYTDIAYRGNLELVLSKGSISVINILSLEEYLYGVLPSEIYSTSGLEALKAQAVAARTIAFKNLGRHKKEGFDFCSDVHCQVYRGITQESKLTNRAVDETRGEVMFFEGKPIETFYHSNCGGCLREDLFGKRKYLSNKLDRSGDNNVSFSPYKAEKWFKERPDVFCSHTPRMSNFRWQRVYDNQDFKMLFDYPLNELVSITILNKGDCEHIDKLKIKTEKEERTIEGDLGVRRYFDNLRSSAFKIAVKYKKINGIKEPDAIFIWGAGFGHGVGMCQEGIEVMAQEGFSYKEILKHYYKNIEIKKAY